MIFGKHINRYYLKYFPQLLLGMLTVIFIDYMQLLIPNLYQMVVNGMNQGFVLQDGVQTAFNMDFLLDHICMPMVGIILAIVFGRFCGESVSSEPVFVWNSSCATGCSATAKT